jgi:putative oxidoreductase
MWQSLLRTDNSVAALVLRLTLGIVMFPHGAQKALGWFGGGGWSGTMQWMGQIGVPAFIAILVILGEFLGSIGLITGTLTRVAAAGMLIIQLGALFKAHLANAFFMNWSGQQAGEGYEYALLAIGISAALIYLGGGRWSVDGTLARSEK